MLFILTKKGLMTCSHGRSQEGGHGGHAFLLAYYFCCATHYLNLSASAAVKVSATQNAENVTQKVVKMFKTSAKKTALLKSSITDVCITLSCQLM